MRLFALLICSALAAEAGAQKSDRIPEAVANPATLAAERCGTCHGPDGRGLTPDAPSLAGQHVQYLNKQIFNFKTGQRTSAAMQPVVENLKAAEIGALTAHFGALPPLPSPAADPARARNGETLYRQGNPAGGVAACISCHGERAAGAALMPRLAGQHAPYLENQLRGFIKKSRTNDNNMHLGVGGLTEPQIGALAAYLSSLE